MYICENCSKEYSSQKRYLSHLEKCQSIDKRSISSSRSILISDIEDDRIRSLSRSRSEKTVERNGSQLKDIVESLMKDKNKLKEELKKNNNNIKHLINEHRSELENAQEYFEEQITNLKQERNELLEKISSSQEFLFQEKERIRDEFNKKLTLEKKRLESVYIDKKNVHITRLASMIEKLESSLNKQLNEKEKLKEDYENQLVEKEVLYNKQLEEITEQLKESKNSIDSERVNIRKIYNAYTEEKEAFKRNCLKEKEKEIEEILMDKRMAIQSIENVKNDLEKTNKIMIKEHENTLIELKIQYETVLQDRNDMISHLKDTHSKNIEQEHNMLTGKIDNVIRKHNSDKEKYMSVMENKIKGIELTHMNLIESLKADALDKLKNLQSELEIEKQKNITIKCEGDNAVKAKEKELVIMYDAKLNELQEEVKNKETIFKKNIEAITEEKNKIINDIEMMNHNLGKQVSYYHSSMTRMKEDTDNIKSQFVINLNKQKEESVIALKEKENKIKDIELQCKSISKEYNNKLLKLKNVLDQTNKELEVSKSEEALKQKKIIELEVNYETNIEQMKKDFCNKINNIREEEKEKIKEQIDILEDQLKKSNSSIEELNNDYNNKLIQFKIMLDEKNKYYDISKQQELLKQNQINELQVNYDKLLNQHESMIEKYEYNIETLKETKKNDTDNIKRILQETEEELFNTRENINKLKINFIEKINEINYEKDTILSEFNTLKKNAEEVETYKSQVDILKQDIINIKEEYLHKFDVQINEINKKWLTSEENFLNKTQECDVLSINIELIKKEFANKLTLLSKENSNDKKKIAELITRIEEYDKKIIDYEENINKQRKESNLEKAFLEDQTKILEGQIKTLEMNMINSYNFEEKINKVKNNYESILLKNNLELSHMEEKLKLAESIIEEKNKDITRILEEKNYCEESFLEKINKQETNKENIIKESQSIIDKKEKRISELEVLVTDTIKKFTEK